MNGAILWRGPSRLNGAPIVVIATGLDHSSGNRKTGDMVQTWILPERVSPTVAVRTGYDESVCGDCKHRPANLGTCYVTVWQAPRGIWAAYKRGSYPLATDLPALGRGRMVRLGAYGDPAAVPVEVWQALCSEAIGHTGYTHQWLRDDVGADYAQLLMASADSPDERDMAQSFGFRTFTVRTADQPLGNRESVCPASDEAGHLVTCHDCGVCNGNATQRRGSIAIVIHGAMSRRFAA